MKNGSLQLRKGCLSNKVEHRVDLCLPSFCLNRQSTKESCDRESLIIIIPLWQTKHWHPLLLQLCVSNPIQLPNNKSLPRNPKGEYHPLIIQRSLTLVAWLVRSGTRSQKVGKLVNGRRCYEMKLRIVQRPEGPAVQSRFYE